jgi:hypothetical protein
VARTGGKSTSCFRRQWQSDLGSSRSAELPPKADSNEALCQLRFAEATILEREEVEFEIK